MPFKESNYHDYSQLRRKALIKSRVANLCLVLDEIEKNISTVRVTDEQAGDLSKLVGCRSVLDDTEKLIQKNEGLGAEPSSLGSKTRKAWKKLEWDSATVNRLRDCMVYSTTSLNTFSTSLARSVLFTSKVTLLEISDFANMRQGVSAHFYPVKCHERRRTRSML